MMMSGSLQRGYRIHGDSQHIVKRAVERHEFQSLEAWASSFEDPPVSRTVLQTFLSGKKNISRERFIAICNDLDLDWRIVAFGLDDEASLQLPGESLDSSKVDSQNIPSHDSDKKKVLGQQEQSTVTNYGHSNVIVTGNHAKVVTVENNIGNVSF